jgi:penicillin-binding protein 1C
MPDEAQALEIKPLRLLRPTNGLQLAMDPRIPDDQEAFSFELDGVPAGAKVDWFIDDQPAGSTSGEEFLWQLRRGTHEVRARVCLGESALPVEAPAVHFTVK